jgi:hypothetical protein
MVGLRALVEPRMKLLVRARVASCKIGRPLIMPNCTYRPPRPHVPVPDPLAGLPEDVLSFRAVLSAFECRSCSLALGTRRDRSVAAWARAELAFFEDRCCHGHVEPVSTAKTLLRVLGMPDQSIVWFADDEHETAVAVPFELAPQTIGSRRFFLTDGWVFIDSPWEPLLVLYRKFLGRVAWKAVYGTPLGPTDERLHVLHRGVVQMWQPKSSEAIPRPVDETGAQQWSMEEVATQSPPCMTKLYAKLTGPPEERKMGYEQRTAFALHCLKGGVPVDEFADHVERHGWRDRDVRDARTLRSSMLKNKVGPYGCKRLCSEELCVTRETATSVEDAIRQCRRLHEPVIGVVGGGWHPSEVSRRMRAHIAIQSSPD